MKNHWLQKFHKNKILNKMEDWIINQKTHKGHKRTEIIGQCCFDDVYESFFYCFEGENQFALISGEADNTKNILEKIEKITEKKMCEILLHIDGATLKIKINKPTSRKLLNHGYWMTDKKDMCLYEWRKNFDFIDPKYTKEISISLGNIKE